MLRLPVGIQSFRKIIEGGDVCADKYAGTGREVYQVAVAVTGRGRVHTRWVT